MSEKIVPSPEEGDIPIKKGIDTLDDVKKVVVDVVRAIVAIDTDNDEEVLGMTILEVGLDSMDRADFVCRVEEILGYKPEQTEDVHEWLEEKYPDVTMLGKA